MDKLTFLSYRSFLISAAHLAIAFIAIILGIHGCATSPRTHFYTLSREGAETEALRTPETQAPFYIEVTAVEIPASAARAQLVITDHSGAVNVKEQHRWLAPLDDQIRAALSEALMRRLQTLDVSHMPHAFNRPVYRITLDVLRFESRIDALASGQANMDAIWSVRRIDENQKNARTALTCRALARESTASDLDSINQGHRRAIGRIADQIAIALRALEAARTGSAFAAGDCPAVTQ